MKSQKKNNVSTGQTENNHHKSKRDIFKEYLEEFFEGNILTTLQSGISYRDMHECFEKDK
jgi:hypothetical protein